MNFQHFPGVLLCDNCTSHIEEEIAQLFAQRNIRLITFPPQTSDWFQHLDLVISGAFKREKGERYVVQAAGSQV
jgi:hypothetical protein